MIYHSDGVESVMMRINFNDGSSIGFSRREDEDDMENLFKEDEDE